MGKPRRPPNARPRDQSLPSLLVPLLVLCVAAAGGAYYYMEHASTASSSTLAQKAAQMAQAAQLEQEQAQMAKQKQKQQQKLKAAAAAAKLREAQVGLSKTPLEEGDVEGFRSQALPLLYNYIFSAYDLYASSTLTFRDMKEHLSQQLGIPYELLRTDEYSAVVEDAVDALTKECRSGEVPMERCARKFGLNPDDYR